MFESELELSLLKTTLGHRSPDAAVEALLVEKLAAARSDLADRGITLREEESRDRLLVVDYAQYLYDKTAGGEMSKALRDRLRDRTVHEVTTA